MMLCKKPQEMLLSSALVLLLIFQLPSCAQDTDFGIGDDEVQINKINNNEGIEKLDEEELSTEQTKLLKGYITKVPSGTKLKIIVETPIDEVTSRVGDEFTARTSEDVIVDGGVVVPAGSTVIGKISEINFAKKLHRAGSVRIEFQSLTTPDVRQIPIVASVLTHSGLIKGKLTKKNALISGATIVAPIAAGAGAGLIAAESSVLGAAVGASLGALAGIALYAFERGNMVDIKAGDEMKIELTEEALVPINANEISSISEIKKLKEGSGIGASVIEHEEEETDFTKK